MASTAGKENPSYSDGMQAISAEANSMASSASDRPLEVCTMSEMPSSAISFSVGPFGSSLATNCSSTSCSPRSLATACSRCPMPFSGRSALEIAMIRPEPGLLMRFEQLGVDAEGHHPQLVGADAEVVGDVGGR